MLCAGNSKCIALQAYALLLYTLSSVSFAGKVNVLLCRHRLYCFLTCAGNCLDDLLCRQYLSQVPGRAHSSDGWLEAGRGSLVGEGAGERSEGCEAGEAGGGHWSEEEREEEES